MSHFAYRMFGSWSWIGGVQMGRRPPFFLAPTSMKGPITLGRVPWSIVHPYESHLTFWYRVTASLTRRVAELYVPSIDVTSNAPRDA